MLHRYLVANARVFSEAVLYHGSLRFLAMNPAVLVILWIRLSVIFGFPATLTEIRTISKVLRGIPQFHSTMHTLPMRSERKLTKSERYSTQPYEDDSGLATFETSPRFINYSTNTVSPVSPNDKHILSIVRVSSTSVVKANTKISENAAAVVAALPLTDNVSSRRGNEVLNSNEVNGEDVYSAGDRKNQKRIENAATPYVSLLRKNRLDIDEDDPKEKPRALSASARVNYVPDYEIKFSRVTFDLKANSDAAAARGVTPDADTLYRRSKSTYDEATTDANTEATVAFTDPYQTFADKERASDEGDDDDDESKCVEQRAGYEEPEKVYGEPEKVYGEPEKVYGEPEKVYGEPEKVYGEPEKVYGEPEKTYEESEKVYKSEITHELPETEDTNEFQLPESSETNSKSYSSFTTRINDKKSSYIVDNGTYRKYRVEEKTADGFIVGEYGMVSHRDGSLRGVRYTADSNINPSLIYETLVKFLSLK